MSEEIKSLEELNTVAEGVETLEQREYLISINCDFVQGYLISKPLDSLDFSSFVENKHGDDQRSEIY